MFSVHVSMCRSALENSVPNWSKIHSLFTEVFYNFVYDQPGEKYWIVGSLMERGANERH